MVRLTWIAAALTATAAALPGQVRRQADSDYDVETYTYTSYKTVYKSKAPTTSSAPWVTATATVDGSANVVVLVPSATKPTASSSVQAKSTITTIETITGFIAPASSAAKSATFAVPANAVPSVTSAVAPATSSGGSVVSSAMCFLGFSSYCGSSTAAAPKVTAASGASTISPGVALTTVPKSVATSVLPQLASMSGIQIAASVVIPVIALPGKTSSTANAGPKATTMAVSLIPSSAQNIIPIPVATEKPQSTAQVVPINLGSPSIPVLKNTATTLSTEKSSVVHTIVVPTEAQILPTSRSITQGTQTTISIVVGGPETATRPKLTSELSAPAAPGVTLTEKPPTPSGNDAGLPKITVAASAPSSSAIAELSSAGGKATSKVVDAGSATTLTAKITVPSAKSSDVPKVTVTADAQSTFIVGQASSVSGQASSVGGQASSVAGQASSVGGQASSIGGQVSSAGGKLTSEVVAPAGTTTAAPPKVTITVMPNPSSQAATVPAVSGSLSNAAQSISGSAAQQLTAPSVAVGASSAAVDPATSGLGFGVPSVSPAGSGVQASAPSASVPGTQLPASAASSAASDIAPAASGSASSTGPPGTCESLARGSGPSLYVDSTGTTYNITCKHDTPGGDIAAVQSPDYASCFSKCDQTPGCVGFSWLINEGPGTCYLKGSQQGMLSTSAADVAMKVINLPDAQSASAGAQPASAGAQSVSSKIPDALTASAVSQTVSAGTPPAPATSAAASATGTPGASCQQIGSGHQLGLYTVTCGADRAGGDLFAGNANSFSGCVPACDARSDCIGFAYVGGSGAGTCYYKSSEAPETANPNVDIAFKPVSGSQVTSPAAAAAGDAGSAASPTSEASAPISNAGGVASSLQQQSPSAPAVAPTTLTAAPVAPSVNSVPSAPSVNAGALTSTSQAQVSGPGAHASAEGPQGAASGVLSAATSVAPHGDVTMTIEVPVVSNKPAASMSVQAQGGAMMPMELWDQPAGFSTATVRGKTTATVGDDTTATVTGTRA